MHLRSLFTAIVAFAVVFTGCDRKPTTVIVEPSTPIPEPVAKTRTAETSRLGGAIDRYGKEPTAGNNAAVRKALADLDGEIAELDQRVATKSGAEREEAAVKLKNLQSYRAAETLRFTKAQAVAGVGATPRTDGRTGAEKLEDSARKAGNAVEDAAKKTGDAIKDAVR